MVTLISGNITQTQVHKFSILSRILFAEQFIALIEPLLERCVMDEKHFPQWNKLAPLAL